MTQPHELTALEQALAVRRGELSPTELVQHALSRVERLDPVLGAFATVAADHALAHAAEAEKLLSGAPTGATSGTGAPTGATSGTGAPTGATSGTGAPPAGLPALLGVPTAIKDLALTAGVPTSFGSAVYAGFVPELDDDSARLLRAAGAISLGKTATPEFGLPPYTEPAGRPPAVTPWDTGRLAGGSSGGAGAAVAGGLVAIAHGTDGGGSIRIPAAACGLVGLKTSRGLVSRGPLGSDPLGMSVAGPLARTVTDAAAMLDALAVPVPGEPYPVTPPAAPGTFLARARRAQPGRLRVGRYATPVLAEVTVEPECLAGYERASALLAELGHEVAELDVGVDADFAAVFETVWAVFAHSYPVGPQAEALLTPLTRWWRARGAAVSGPELLAAMRSAQAVSRQVSARHAEVDVVLTPTLAQLPKPVGWFTDGGDPAEDLTRQKAFTPFTALYNVTGHPALSLPLHWTGPPEGPAGAGLTLPVGVQLVGPRGGDALLLELGAQLEAAAPWRDRRPPTW